jgi:hypothetical protein
LSWAGSEGFIVVLGVCTLATWVMVCVAWIVPKRLIKKDAILLYFINTIFVVTTFAILTLNLKFFTIAHSAEIQIGILMCHNVLMPLSLVVFENISLNQSRRIRALGTVVILVSLTLFHKLLELLGAIDYVNWSMFHALLLTAALLIFSRLVTYVLMTFSKDALET